MQGNEPFRGEAVLWRSVPDDAVSYCFAANVIEANDRHVALYQPHGAPIRLRTGARGGPRGSILRGGWDGGHQELPWNGGPSVRVHPRGRHYAVIRQWDSSAQRFDGWYVNLELAWQRSVAGFDSRDLVLDIVAERDLSTWRWKDEDHLAWSVEQRILSSAQAQWIRNAGWQAVADLDARTPIFTDDEWDQWVPDGSWPFPFFGADWASKPAVQEWTP
ncbi:DUF402 domain-containing protein [Paramicrobacterium agarici]|uniref:Uncharacterized protein DUF402 n=1 Tax=Paramicrobacterium agarici TaxID=630514 RepID=A0A2A9DUL5_9MICO|nr:DUF402 domain-containing protein [Microbacterium agarici]PFG29672.1 uncharacterized protein DUF402 [Microbacterium agarici]